MWISIITTKQLVPLHTTEKWEGSRNWDTCESHTPGVLSLPVCKGLYNMSGKTMMYTQFSSERTFSTTPGDISNLTLYQIRTI